MDQREIQRARDNKSILTVQDTRNIYSCNIHTWLIDMDTIVHRELQPTLSSLYMQLYIFLGLSDLCKMMIHVPSLELDTQLTSALDKKTN